MNSFQVMHFVDKANPQQLQQMVAARDPYSYMALAKLQEIRDNKLKADAKQPEAPPLTQTIPQQIAQLDQPQGIASLPQAPQAMLQVPQAMPPEMPPEMQQAMQQAPQDMQQAPQDMQQASGIGPAMAPTGAGGGLVSFKHGGIAHFQVGGQPYSNFGALFDSAGNYFTQQREENEKLNEARRVQREKDRILGETIYKNTILNPFASYTKEEREAKAKAVADAKAQLYPASAATPVKATPVPVDNKPTFQTPDPRPLWMQSVSNSSQPDVAAQPTAPAMPGSTGPGTGMFGSQINDLGRLQRAALAQNELIANSLRFDPAADKVARGNLDEDSDAAYEKMKLKFPDPSSKARTNLDAAQKENESETKQAPYQGLLKMSLALMGTKSPNFLQALGNAGGEGLQEYKSINENNKKRRDSLIAADAQMSAAQDARSRGLYSDSRNLAFQAQQSRMQALLAERQAKTEYAGLMMGLNLANANVSATQIALRMEAIKTAASVSQAMKPPDAILTMQFLEKYPKFKIDIQNAETVKNVMAAVGKAESHWETESKLGADLVKNAQMTMPEYNAKYGDAAKDRFINRVRISTLESAKSTREALESKDRPSIIPSSAFNVNNTRGPFSFNPQQN